MNFTEKRRIVKISQLEDRCKHLENTIKATKKICEINPLLGYHDQIIILCDELIK